jgi:hypothetical protein
MLSAKNPRLKVQPRVVDPDLHGSALISLSRDRIRIGNSDPIVIRIQEH